MGSSLADHLDLCLGCLACETACPSGVKYRNLIETSRAQLERRYKRGWFDRLFKSSLFRIFPYSNRLRIMLPFFFLASFLNLKRFLSSGFLSRINPKVASLISVLPDVKSPYVKRLPEKIISKTKKRYRVAMLSGCVQSVFFPETNQATANVLSANGCEVLIPRHQGCCGALSIHSGRLDEGRRFARKMIDVFERLEADAFIVNSAGCGSSIKEYAGILKDDPDYKVKAQRLSAKTKDVMEFLYEIGLESELKPLDLKITYQDACHIVHGQRIKNEPRAILNEIPGLEISEMKNSDHCCGSAGIYNIVQPEMSDRILSEKLDNIEQVNPDYILAGNPGCLLQISKGLKSRGKKIKTAHPVEVLDWSLKGKMK